MADEMTAIMYSCLKASYKEVNRFIEPYRHEYKWLTTGGVQQIQIRGNFSICSYIGNRRYVKASPFSSPIEIISPNMLIPKQLANYKKWFSNSDSGIVEIKPLNDVTGEPTEVNITCYDSRVKFFYEELKSALRRNFEVLYDVELGQSKTGEPRYTSRSDYYIQQEKGKGENQNGKEIKILTLDEAEHILSNTIRMKQYKYKDYAPETAKKIIQILPDAWLIFVDGGGTWGPGIISKVCEWSSNTISRYISAIKKAGIHAIEFPDGEIIGIPPLKI
jgi:hypothetical protein